MTTEKIVIFSNPTLSESWVLDAYKDDCMRRERERKEFKNEILGHWWREVTDDKGE